MRHACWAIAIYCFFAGLCASAQERASTRKIVLPSPGLIHCRSAECSKLWKEDPGDSRAVYPAQVFTDLVKGEIVGLTVVYDNSVSPEELRTAINNIYGASPVLRGRPVSAWRIESEQFAISMYDGTDGATQVTYLKFGSPKTLVPSAHIDCRK